MENHAPPALRSAAIEMPIHPARLSIIALCLAAAASAQEKAPPPARMMSAFEAVGLLTPEQQAALARVAARDGAPNPERWHLLIHDPAGEAGLREFVVADGKIVATRPVSQFAESLTPADVFADRSLIFDSIHVARIAQEYCRTNGVTAAVVHYDLRKSGTDTAALWTLICVNAQGEELGRLVISAGHGTVLFHPGFAAEPMPEQLLDRPRPAPLTNSPVTLDSSRGKTSDASVAPPKRKPAAPPTPPPKPNFFQRVFGGAAH